jgi:hypothetical protein
MTTFNANVQVLPRAGCAQSSGNPWTMMSEVSGLSETDTFPWWAVGSRPKSLRNSPTRWHGKVICKRSHEKHADTRRKRIDASKLSVPKIRLVLGSDGSWRCVPTPCPPAVCS